MKDYELCIEELERFLPHIDNWATCDLLAVRTVKNHLNSYIKKIDRWLESEYIYTIRFGINMLMRYYLEEEFKLEYPGSCRNPFRRVLCKYGQGMVFRNSTCQKV